MEACKETLPEPDVYRRVPLAAGSSLALDGYTCENLALISADGGSGLVYEATSSDYYATAKAATAKLVVKECFPVDVAAFLVRDPQTGALAFAPGAPEAARSTYGAYLDRFAEAFFVHTSLYQSALREQVTVPSRTCFTQGSAYTVSDAAGGVSLAQVMDSLPAASRLAVLVDTARFLEGLHAQGWLYLDLKPSNILVLADGDTAPTGKVKFFDFDTVCRAGEVVRSVPSSGVWAAYEQTHPECASQIGPATDAYALGVLAFRLLFGRTPTAAEIIHVDGNWQVDVAALAPAFVRAGAGETAKAQVKALFDAALVVEPERRAQQVATLRAILEELAGMFAPADAAVAAEFAKLNETLAEAAAAPKKHLVRRAVIAALAAAVLVGAGMGVKAAVDAADRREEQLAASAKDAQVLGKWVSTHAQARDDLAIQAWDTQATFEFFADHTMLWTQDGVTHRYAWAYSLTVPEVDGGYDQYVIHADPDVYGLVNFVVYPGGTRPYRCYLVFAGDPLEDFHCIFFAREGEASE